MIVRSLLKELPLHLLVVQQALRQKMLPMLLHLDLLKELNAKLAREQTL